MGVFLYFLPVVTKDQVTRDTLAAAGLGDVLRDCLRTQVDFQTRLSLVNVSKGPTGTSGTVAIPLPIDGREVFRLGYYPSHQDWSAIAGGKYWLGTDREHMPTPRDLQRPSQVSGYEYMLGDGEVWTCPTIRYPAGAPNLPQAWGLSPAGDFEEAIIPDYAWAWDLAGEIWDIFMGEKTAERPECFAYAVRCLGLNYRIGPHEASRLKLLTSENYSLVFKAAVDGPLIERLLAEDEASKKKQPAAGAAASSTPGPAEDSPSTDPAAASCSS